MTIAPGLVRDSIVGFLSDHGRDASIVEIHRAVELRAGEVPDSSVRSYLRLHADTMFERTARGRYRLRTAKERVTHVRLDPAVRDGKAVLYHADCFEWLAGQLADSCHAVVTDPPYGVVEYSVTEIEKLRNGRGGVWRIPPSFDGNRRAPLPRFTTLRAQDRQQLFAFFRRLGTQLNRVVVPGGNIIVASNPLLCHVVVSALSEAGLEPRGYISRLVMTMRGGDRPKNAHEEFDDVSVMPRSQWEPWVVMRRAPEGRVQDNLRKWGTGGFRRISDKRPFGDVIRSAPTAKKERDLAPHPSLKPQQFLRQLVRAALPLGQGIILDPFAGSGSTLAAANAVGYQSVGIEADPRFIRVAESALPKLSILKTVEPV